MVKLREEFNNLINHEYLKYEETLENKRDFGDKLYKFFFHLRDVAYKIGNEDVISAVNCGMHDWCKCARMIQYEIYNHLTIQQKFNVASYLNIIFKEIAHFISCGKFQTITKNLTTFYVPEYPAYPKYKYCKPLKKWKLYMSKEDLRKLCDALKNKFQNEKNRKDLDCIVQEFENYYDNYDYYWSKEETNL